jgi:hypothetical protein
MAFGEVVVNGDLMAGVEKFFGANGADVSRAASDENVHVNKFECRITKSETNSNVKCAKKTIRDASDFRACFVVARSPERSPKRGRLKEEKKRWASG